MEKLSQEKLKAFCSTLAATGMVRKACETIGISMTTAFKWRKEISQFSEMWDEAVNVSTTLAEDEAWRRAVTGFEKPIHYKGELVDTMTCYSDALLVTLLKARKPDVYKDNSKVELTGRLELSSMSDEELMAELAYLTHPERNDDGSDLV